MSISSTSTRDGRLVHATLAVILLRFIVALLAFIVTVVISRSLGPEGRGQYYLPILAALTIATLGKLGLEQANVYFYGSRRLTFSQLFLQNTLVAAVSGSLGFLLLLIIGTTVPHLIGNPSWAVVVMVALTLPFTIHTHLTASLQTILGLVTRQFQAGAVGGVVHLLALVALAISGRLAVDSAVAAYAVSAVLVWILTLLGRRPQPIKSSELANVSLLSNIRHAAFLHAGMALFFLHLRADAFLLQLLAGATAVGLYSLAVVLTETVLLVTDSIAIAVLSRQVEAPSPASAVFALQVAKLNALIALVIGGLWVLLGPLVLQTFFGQAFLASYLPLIALLPGAACLAVQRLCGPVVLRTGNTRPFILINAIGLAANITLNLVLIPPMGTVGSAVAASLSYAVTTSMFVVWVARVAGRPLTELIRVTSSDIRSSIAIAHSVVRWSRRLRPSDPRRDDSR